MGDVQTWTETDVTNWISSLPVLNQYAGLFKSNNITGKHLKDFNDAQLTGIGIQSFGHRIDLLEAIKKIESSGYNAKSTPLSQVKSEPRLEAGEAGMIVMKAVQAIKDDNSTALLAAVGEIGKYCKALFDEILTDDRDNIANNLTNIIIKSKNLQATQNAENKKVLLIALRDLQKAITEGIKNKDTSPKNTNPFVIEATGAQNVEKFSKNIYFTEKIFSILNELVVLTAAANNKIDKDITTSLTKIVKSVKNVCEKKYDNGIGICEKAGMTTLIIDVLNEVVQSVRELSYTKIVRNTTVLSCQLKLALSRYSELVCDNEMTCSSCRKLINEEMLFCMGEFGCQRKFHRNCLRLSSLSFECVMWNCSLSICNAKEEQKKANQKKKDKEKADIVQSRKNEEEELLRKIREAEDMEEKRKLVRALEAKEAETQEEQHKAAVKAWEEEQSKKNRPKMTNAEAIELYGADAKLARANEPYDLLGGGDDDLTFDEGDIIKIFRNIDGDTYIGLCEGKKGQFPASWVTVFNDPDNEFFVPPTNTNASWGEGGGDGGGEGGEGGYRGGCSGGGGGGNSKTIVLEEVIEKEYNPERERRGVLSSEDQNSRNDSLDWDKPGKPGGTEENEEKRIPSVAKFTDSASGFARNIKQKASEKLAKNQSTLGKRNSKGKNNGKPYISTPITQDAHMQKRMEGYSSLHDAGSSQWFAKNKQNNMTPPKRPVAPSQAASSARPARPESPPESISTRPEAPVRPATPPGTSPSPSPSPGSTSVETIPQPLPPPPTTKAVPKRPPPVKIVSSNSVDIIPPSPGPNISEKLIDFDTVISPRNSGMETLQANSQNSDTSSIQSSGSTISAPFFKEDELNSIFANLNKTGKNLVHEANSPTKNEVTIPGPKPSVNKSQPVPSRPAPKQLPNRAAPMKPPPGPGRQAPSPPQGGQPSPGPGRQAPSPPQGAQSSPGPGRQAPSPPQGAQSSPGPGRQAPSPPQGAQPPTRPAPKPVGIKPPVLAKPNVSSTSPRPVLPSRPARLQ